MTLLLSACGGGSFSGNDSSSREPASAEPAYYGTPTAITNGLHVTASAKFLYRKLDFNPATPASNGLSTVAASGIAIPFAEFHIYDSSGNRIQQGETDTDGIAAFDIPKTSGHLHFESFLTRL